MKFEITGTYTWSMRLAMMVATSSTSLFLVASIGFKATDMVDSRFLIIPQININIITLFYAYFKTRLLSYSRGQLVLSTLLAGVYVFFFAKIFPIIDQPSSLLKVVESINLIVAILLLAESVCTYFIDKNDKAEEEEIFADNRRAREERQRQQQSGSTTAAGDSIATPAAIHLYQPRLDFSPPSIDNNTNNRTSVISTTAAGIEEVRLDMADDYELDELPKYQRKPPAQSATIIDMANIASVNPAVLNNVVRPLSISSSSSSSPSEVQALDMLHEAQRPLSALEQHQPEGEQQEQQTRREDILPSDAPEYSLPSISTSSSSSAPSVPSSSQGVPSKPPTYVP
ncbi:hypothetical protein BGZ95_002037 [Linnemannia exigua]|uniref:Uncharacterized protein n=1 Tax=Linnemannia exigua TaxID=604196 RepID=A0AAD4H9I9_9FUNG|nr:hypothetical protein BGZ95_002037 [Linnemannia exigua]